MAVRIDDLYDINVQQLAAELADSLLNIQLNMEPMVPINSFALPFYEDELDEVFNLPIREMIQLCIGRECKPMEVIVMMLIRTDRKKQEQSGIWKVLKLEGEILEWKNDMGHLCNVNSVLGLFATLIMVSINVGNPLQTMSTKHRLLSRLLNNLFELGLNDQADINVAVFLRLSQNTSIPINMKPFLQLYPTVRIHETLRQRSIMAIAGQRPIRLLYSIPSSIISSNNANDWNEIKEKFPREEIYVDLSPSLKGTNENQKNFRLIMGSFLVGLVSNQKQADLTNAVKSCLSKYERGQNDMIIRNKWLNEGMTFGQAKEKLLSLNLTVLSAQWDGVVPTNTINLQ